LFRNLMTLMTQQRNTNWLSFQTPMHRALLLHGLSWVGGLSILSGGIGLAQTTPSADPVVVPTAQDLLAPEPVAPAAPAPAPVSQPDPAPQVVVPTVSQPEVSIELAPAPTEPQVSAETQPAPSFNDAYIDTTDYNIGATRSPDQPAVVLSERSTGCQVVLQRGQSAPASLCTAPRRVPTVASVQTQRAGNARAVNVGSLQVSANGFSVGTTTPSGQAYYNRTMRPAGRLGNGNVAAIFPLSIPVAITSAFGWRIHPITGDRRFHSGTDLGAPLGTPVLAAFAGQVAVADFMRGYGLTVVLQHNDASEETLYAHMSELFVRPGEWVEQGTVIGRVGSTGNSTGPHLHFEFRELTSDGWQALDPGQMLEYSLAQLVQSLQTAQAQPEQRQAGNS
jgi:murein DD-endopeptidase MepM/ murein hydrolase activator NlpD